jgi:membrane fusion protein, multidrug efflux system
MMRRYSAISLMILATSCAKGQASTQVPAAEASISVKATAAIEAPMPTYLTVTGSLVANQQSEVAAGANGKVVKTLVERGSVVPANQLLVQLDSRALSDQAAEAQANLDVAKRQRELADVQCGRSEKLFKDGALSRDDYDKTKANCETTRLSATASEARAEAALAGLSDSQIRAPFAGLIAERYVNLGEYVQPATKVVRLVELDPLRLELTVPEASLHLVSEGMAVSFVTTIAPTVVHTGTVRFIGPSVRTSSRDLVVEALVPNPDRSLRPGEFVLAKLVLGETPSATVPKVALHTDGQLQRIYVVSSGHHLEERLVELGETKGEQVAIAKGIKPGEQVVTQAEGDLRDGLLVKGQ